MLETEHRQMESAASKNKDLRAQLTHVQSDRDRLQSDFDALMRQPFFKQESNEKNLQNISNLQKTLDSKENEILKMKSAIAKSETDAIAAITQSKAIQREKSHLEDDLKKMR